MPGSTCIVRVRTHSTRSISAPVLPPSPKRVDKSCARVQTSTGKKKAEARPDPHNSSTSQARIRISRPPHVLIVKFLFVTKRVGVGEACRRPVPAYCSSGRVPAQSIPANSSPSSPRKATRQSLGFKPSLEWDGWSAA